MEISAIVVAAGTGTRLGGSVPKQYQRVAGEMVLTRTLRAIMANMDLHHIVVAINPDAAALYKESVETIDDARLQPPVHGGATRSQTVRRALEALAEHGPSGVLIHDGARPFVRPASLEAIIGALRDGEAAILAEPVVDALWRADGEHADRPQARDGLWRAQTPQAFPYQAILAAHREEDTRTGTPALDDAEVFRRAGGQVRLIPGDPDNFKITTAPDMERAERLARQETIMDVRTGHGFDVHRFREGSSVWLCGVEIPHTHALEGHSDADVGLHALADAIYGALGDGDIGRHFPPSDPQWKGAESHVFLSHAASRVASRGGRLSNVDVTLLCEAPKIAPHADAMRERIASLLQIAVERVSIKATTMERMGFVGREEGMGAMATATIVLPGRDV